MADIASEDILAWANEIVNTAAEAYIGVIDEDGVRLFQRFPAFIRTEFTKPILQPESMETRRSVFKTTAKQVSVIGKGKTTYKEHGDIPPGARLELLRHWKKYRK